MMDVRALEIEGVRIINNISREDSRGLFVKPFTNIIDTLKELSFDINEIYFSISKKNVIRGMHFQRPPMDHAKLIYLTSGKITDVLIDLRKSSKSYKEHIAIDLSAHKSALYIPPGVAHGFLSKENGTTVIYNQSTVYSKEHDDGILWNSFGYNWGVDQPILSERDKSFIGLKQFESPFD
jgi:dTDP-4-dehydrorhamnose 3,5-epimerase